MPMDPASSTKMPEVPEHIGMGTMQSCRLTGNTSPLQPFFKCVVPRIGKRTTKIIYPPLNARHKDIMVAALDLVF